MILPVNIPTDSIRMDTQRGYNNGANLVAVGKLQYLNNVHLAGALTMAGNMARPSVLSNYNIGNAATVSVTPFDWPLGSALNGGQYSFQKVISFDPQGVGRIRYSTNSDTHITLYGS